MGLDNGLFDAQELGAANFPVVHHLHHFIHTGLAEQISDLGEKVAFDCGQYAFDYSGGQFDLSKMGDQLAEQKVYASTKLTDFDLIVLLGIIVPVVVFGLVYALVQWLKKTIKGKQK